MQDWFPDDEQWKKGMGRLVGRKLTLPLLLNAALEEAGIVSNHEEMKKEIWILERERLVPSFNAGVDFKYQKVNNIGRSISYYSPFLLELFLYTAGSE